MPISPKDEYEKLIRWADKYIRHPNTSPGSAVARWRNKSVLWLRKHTPDSRLAEEFLTIPAPNHEGRGLSHGNVKNIQRALRVFLRARDLLPFLAADRQARIPRPENAKKVFVVHGHNDALKTAAARLLTKLQLEPIILHEQPNKSRTIIEKFLDYSDVAFALVLLTADDWGGLVNGPPESYNRRARQNVILELGFFIGRLGRERVVAIYEAGVEIPSDYSGVLFIPFDSGGIWQYQAAKEMKAAGIKIDMSHI
ncbi:MAG: nucleotide-binding protein [Verrucomicrobia bacterium]|nr:nucleotide-binding protein [Verrucomicrobiota bacterium]